MSMKNDLGTQIRIEKSTLELLKKLGTYRESYNDIIKRLAKKELGD